jgi:hypothetical protein
VRRDKLIRQVSRALGRRRLIWSGIRGDDIEPLADLPQLEAAYSIIGSYRRRASVEALAYEDLTGVRVDLETWDIDEHLEAEATTRFRREMLRSLGEDSALLPYRPSRFLSAIWFARRDRCINLGLFGGHQSAFEHKPWVETAVADLGLPRIPWTYVADEEQLTTKQLLAEGPVMLRRSRTSGGEGIFRADDVEELARQWPHIEEAFVSVAPYLDGGLPVNVGATVWHDGVTVHHPSVQLIGIRECVTRPFGYCGNDFGVARDIPRPVIQEIEDSTRAIGRWMASFGYRGTFGADFLVHEGRALFTEINPRFQGSTHASSRLSIAAGESCLMLEHVAAMLGIDAPSQPPLADVVREIAPLAHLVVHWTGDSTAQLDAQSLARGLNGQGLHSQADVVAGEGLTVERGAAVGRFTTPSVLTRTGFDLSAPWRAVVRDWNQQMVSDERATNGVGSR